MGKIKGLLKWSIIGIIGYNVITILFFGYTDLDSKTGKYNFYWSGLKSLWEEDKSFGFKADDFYETHLNGTDGPYILNDKIYKVNDKNELSVEVLDSTKLIKVKTEFSEMAEFSVIIKEEYPAEKDVYSMPQKLFAISDIEGNFIAFYSILLANKVIDAHGNWNFGEGHLVLNGDFFDRGSEVTQLLWFIYHLEDQAIQNGGKVHFILGNHEIMNLYGNASDNDFKYIEVARKISGKPHWNEAVSYLYSENSVLGKWLRSKNIVEKIGDILFVHGGLNQHHWEENISISELNSIARQYMGKYPSEEIINREKNKFVLGSMDSPYWDRRLIYDWKNRLYFLSQGVWMKKTSQKEVEKILKFYDVSKMIIGHSVVEDISADYQGKVIRIDVEHGDKMSSGKTKGLLIENNQFYKTDDLGNKHSL